MKQIWFDMDGTIADLYGVENWLTMLRDYDPTPYAIAAPMLHLATLARYLNRAQREGWQLGIVSWLSKESTPDYDEKVAAAKIWWLEKHLPSVKWDKILIVPYGTNKWELCGGGVLFDDEGKNRENWGGEAYEPFEIINWLKGLVA